MSRRIDADLFRQYEEDSDWWETMHADEEHFVDDQIQLYSDETEEWLPRGQLAGDVLGLIYDSDFNVVCSVVEDFDDWCEARGISEWVTKTVRVARKHEAAFDEAVKPFLHKD